MAGDPYRTSLDETRIRLLKVSVDEGSTNLKMSLEEFSLDDPIPAYAAVSYVWAPDASDERPAFGEDRVEVSASLWKALIYIARCRQHPRLWVDALCINQADSDEKASQVRIMHRIFAGAEYVLIWLGSIEDEEERRVEVALQMQREASEAQSLLTEEQARQCNRAFLPMLSKRWFNRAWTWQESYVARSRKFFWGHLTCDQDFMYNFLNQSIQLAYELRKDGSFLDHFLRKIVPMLTGLTPLDTLVGKFDFASAMRERRAAGCKYPSDIVYSVMNASPNAPKLPVDYVQPCFTTFAQAAYLNIKQTGSLAILSQAQQHLQTAVSIDAKREEWSSWVPDWRWPYRDDGTRLSSHSAAAATQARPSVTSDWKVLTLKGVFLDTLTEDINIQTPIPGSQQQPKQEEIYAPTSEPTSDALSNTMSLGRKSYVVTTVADMSPKDRLRWAMIFGIPHMDKAEAQKVLRNEDPHHRYIKDAKVATTKQGYFANVPMTAQHGDVITILYGGNMPLVLRPVAYTEKPGMAEKVKYTLVGQCYVHGFMNGEALQTANKEEQPNVEDISPGRPVPAHSTMDFDIV